MLYIQNNVLESKNRYPFTYADAEEKSGITSNLKEVYMRSVCVLYGLHLRALTAVEIHHQSYRCLVSTTSRSFGVIIVTVLVVFFGSAA